MKKNQVKKLAVAALLCAVAVAGSTLSFPVFGSKCAPVQHMVNILFAVFLGPWYGLAGAFTSSLLRNLMSLGSLMAFPGSMFGALFVGLAARALPERYKLCAACAEPVGTGIVGAWVGAKILGPILGKGIGFLFFSSSFLMSSVPGAVIGALLVYCLQKRMALTRTFGAMI